MPVRGIRGATTAAADTPDAILTATQELLQALVAANAIELGEIASVIFTTTPDLTTQFPARAARHLGWHDVPLLGATEMAVPGAPERCIRVLIHLNTDRPAAAIRHVYLHGAADLRRDR
jgi:chorismate mutase